MEPHYSSMFDGFNRITLLEQATPIQRLFRLEHELGNTLGGVRLFVKRDDTGLGGGGNKLRKLEFLLGEAVSQGCDTFLTTGGVQSNHARLSAAAAARAGLACELVLSQLVEREDLEYQRNGNILLDKILGAKVHKLSGTANSLEFAKERAEVLKSQGRRPYVVGNGGSSPVGCLGYAACAQEIAAQEQTIEGGFSHIVIPNGSSGTHAGLAAGFTALGESAARVRSYTVLAPLDKAKQNTLDLARATLTLIDKAGSIDSNTIDVAGDQLGDGYGIPTPAMFSAVRAMAQTEGLLLDPVYSGKAFAGLLDSVKRGAYKSGDNILYIMTGGTPGLFAYRSAFELSDKQASTAHRQPL